MAFLTMEDSRCSYVITKTRLVVRFPCNSAGFRPYCALPLKDPEHPRDAPNLSPEPSPKRRRL
jgi:hypothetical protein